MPLRTFTRTSNGSYVLLNPDQVVAAYAVDEGTRVITTANNDEGPVAFTVKETLEEVMVKLKNRKKFLRETKRPAEADPTRSP